jgi:DNA polymerase-3 subunit epsilon
MWSEGFVAFDTETTGVDSSARILEVACVTFERGVIVNEWSQMLCPENVDWDNPNVKKALSVNNIDVNELRDKPKFGDIVSDLLVELAHPVWVAHNMDFDLRMMNMELQRLSRPVLSPQLLICTLKLASRLNNGAPGNQLRDVACRFNVLQEGAHRAAADAITCGRVLARMHEQGHLPSDDEEMRAFCQRAAAFRSRRW